MTSSFLADPIVGRRPGGPSSYEAGEASARFGMGRPAGGDRGRPERWWLGRKAGAGIPSDTPSPRAGVRRGRVGRNEGFYLNRSRMESSVSGGSGGPSPSPLPNTSTQPTDSIRAPMATRTPAVTTAVRPLESRRFSTVLISSKGSMMFW